MPANLKSINGVEVFAAGVWNGDEYSENDLDEIVRAFNETNKGWKPYLKLGHDDSQKILQNDGLPAAGWIGKLYRSGKKLMADFVDIPEKIYQLIENKAYRKVSCEIYWNMSVNGTRYPFVLGAVALLGSDLPGVQNLSDILGMYGIELSDKIKIYKGDDKEAIVKQYAFLNDDDSEGVMPKTEAEIKLELELQKAKEEKEAADAQLKKFTADQDKMKADLDAAQKARQDAEAQVAEAKKATEKVQLESFVSSLVADKIATPAMKPFILELLGEEKKEYTLEVNKEKKNFSKQDLLKEALKLHAASDVNLEEGSEEGQKSKGNSDDLIEEKIKKFMADQKCDYKTAYKAVAKEHRPQKAKPINTMVDAE